MKETKLQLSEDTWVYVDEERSKLIVEIDIPKKEDSFDKLGERFKRITDWKQLN